MNLTTLLLIWRN